MDDEAITEHIRKVELIAATLPTNDASRASPTLANQETISYSLECHNSIKKRNQLFKIRNKLSLRLEFVFRFLYLFISYLFFSCIFRNDVVNSKYLIRTWLVDKSFKDKLISDDYFRENFIDSIKSITYQKPVELYIPLGINFNLIKFFKYRKINQYIIFDFLTVKDIVRLFTSYLTKARVKGIKDLVLASDPPFVFLLAEIVDQDFFKMRSFQYFLESMVAKKLLKKTRSFFYIFENQSYEQAWLQNKSQFTKMYGFQSSGFSKKFFNFFPKELDIQGRLYPEYILTGSPIYTKILKSHFKKSQILTLGTDRIDWSVNMHSDLESKRKSNKVIVLLPVHFRYYQQVVDSFSEKFRNKGVEVWYRPHPLNIRKLSCRSLGSFGRIHDPRINDKNMFSDFRCCFSFDNSLAFDSLLSGTVTFELDDVSLYDDSRFLEFNAYDAKVSLKSIFEYYTRSVELYEMSVVKQQADYCRSFYFSFNKTVLKELLT